MYVPFPSGRLVLAGAVALAAATPTSAEARGWETAGDIGRNVLVGAALGIPVIKGDWQGGLQAGGSILLGSGVTYGLKRIIPSERPDGSDSRSFPSGHATTAFAAAATLDNRYGWKVGIPAFAVATFVGASRVAARKHRWYDVVAGAAIGTGSGLLITSKRNSSVRLLPFGDSKGGGVAFAMRF